MRVPLAVGVAAMRASVVLSQWLDEIGACVLALAEFEWDGLNEIGPW